MTRERSRCHGSMSRAPGIRQAEKGVAAARPPVFATGIDVAQVPGAPGLGAAIGPCDEHGDDNGRRRFPHRTAYHGAHGLPRAVMGRPDLVMTDLAERSSR